MHSAEMTRHDDANCSSTAAMDEVSEHKEYTYIITSIQENTTHVFWSNLYVVGGHCKLVTVMENLDVIEYSHRN